MTTVRSNYAKPVPRLDASPRIERDIDASALPAGQTKVRPGTTIYFERMVTSATYANLSFEGRTLKLTDAISDGMWDRPRPPYSQYSITVDGKPLQPKADFGSVIPCGPAEGEQMKYLIFSATIDKPTIVQVRDAAKQKVYNFLVTP